MCVCVHTYIYIYRHPYSLFFEYGNHKTVHVKNTQETSERNSTTLQA